tara:strand:+ start:210 stop:560 length:351 start_codon:yes stop_codon:yes gene_type:complete
MKTISALILILLLSACTSAKKSNEVNKAYVSTAKYNSFTCEQLINEAELIRAREPGLAAKVDKHYKSQKNTELVTWVLFWPAAFWLDDGSEDAERLSQVRGELDAVRSSMMSKKCS